MKLAQRKIKLLARLMLGLVLFAQMIVAANACVAPGASPMRAYTMAQQDDEAMPCHQHTTPNANLCLAHCTQADQISMDQHHMPVAAPANVIAWIGLQPQVEFHPVIFPEHLVPDTGPPIPIRFCSLLN